MVYEPGGGDFDAAFAKRIPHELRVPIQQIIFFTIETIGFSK